MKRLISIILTICLIMSLGAYLISCDEDDTDKDSSGKKDRTTQITTADPTTDNNNDNAGDDAKSKLLLPEKFTLSGLTEEDIIVPFTWTKNSCTITVEGSTFLFEYDEAANALNLKGTSANGVFSESKDFCKFDEKGRVTSVSYDGELIIGFSYEGGKMSVTNCTSSEASFPIVLTPNFDSNTVIAPPFESSNSYAHFNEHGDLIGITDEEYYELFKYEYDENGNINKTTLASTSITFTYSEDTIDGAWQQYVIKFINFTMRSSLSVFVTDVMCENLPR